MAFVTIHPRYRDDLERRGYVAAEDFLALPAVIISGHPERNVARVTIRTDTESIPAFLKREHRVRRRDRLANALAGYGFCSRSEREARLLEQVRAAGFHCPEWIAFGEDRHGRAFTLIRRLTDYRELRTVLAEAQTAARKRLSRSLGAMLARLHEAGFDHPDVYAKHVFVHPTTDEIALIDWQQARRRNTVPWAQRLRTLAILDASLNDTLASSIERRLCVRSYLAACRAAPGEGMVLAEIARLSERLQQRRSVREQRLPPLPEGTQAVVWLDGEALCVTHRFWEELQCEWPAELSRLRGPLEVAAGLHREHVTIPDGRSALLTYRRSRPILAWLWSLLRGKRPESPELRRAGFLYRCERAGNPGPRLLAFGQRQLSPWRMQSFLLTELPTEFERSPANV